MSAISNLKTTAKSRMTSAYILLLLPALVFGRIDVQVSGKFNPESQDLRVYFSGSDVGVISDAERLTFQLGDENLKNGVKAYFGGRPTDVYMRSPTPWGDLYQSHGWNQVMRSLVPLSGKVLAITSKPEVIVEQIFENNSSKPAMFNVAISQKVMNTMKTSWSKSGKLSLNNDINYKFDFFAGELGGRTTLNYTTEYGENEEKSMSTMVGATAAMELLLQPGQSVMSKLSATRGYVQIEMEYEASLTGALAVNYDIAYRGHHFWALDINAVMEAAGLRRMVRNKEVVEIGFYTDSRVVVQDRTTQNKLIETML